MMNYRRISYFFYLPKHTHFYLISFCKTNQRMGNFEPTLCLHKTATVYYFLQYLLIKKKTQVQNVSVFELTIEMNMYTLCSLNSWNIFLNWDLNFKCYLGYISYQEFIAFDLCSDKCACCAFLNCAINERLQTRLL